MQCQEPEERIVSTACQTDPWVPECSCAAVEKRSTGTITKDLGAQLDCAHDHQYTTESCPYTPQMELTESEISEDHTSLYEPESSESQTTQCEPRYTINHFGGVGWCSENGEGAGHSTANSKIHPSIKGNCFSTDFFYLFQWMCYLVPVLLFRLSLSTYECSAMKSQLTFAPEVLNCCTLYNQCGYYFFR